MDDSRPGIGNESSYPWPVDLDVPPSLAARPVHERMGVPIPAFADLAFIGREGYNLNAVHPMLVKRFAERRWCYICAQPISIVSDAWFLGDEQSFIQGYYPETLGHERCMLAALKLCPYIFGERYKRATEQRLGHEQILEDPNKPVIWVLASSRYYKYSAPNGRAGLYPRQLRNPRYFGYAEGELVEYSLDQANAILAEHGLDPLPGADDPGAGH